MTPTTFSNPELERKIEKEHAKNMHEVKSSARFFAESDKPHTDENDLSPYIGNFITRYDQLQAYAEKQIQSSLNKAQGAMILSAWKEQNDKLQNRMEDTKHKVKLLKHQAENIILTYNWSLYEVIILGIVASSSMEAFLSRGAFQLFGENLGISYIIALCFAVIMGFLAHFIAKYFKNSKTERQLKIRMLATTAVMSVFFYLLAMLRIMFFEKIGIMDEKDALSPFYFTLMNLIFFGTSVVLAYLYLPTKEERRAKDRQKELKKEIEKGEKEIFALSDEQEKAITKRDEALSERMAIMEYGKYISKWIQALKTEIVEEFKITNIHNRKTPIPNCFKQTL